MKRCLSAILAAILLLVCIPFTASAAGVPTLSVDGATVQAGDTFTVAARITNPPTKKKLTMWVCYDATVLEPQFTTENTEEMKGDAFKGILDIALESGKVQLSLKNTTTASGILVHLTFKAKVAPCVTTLRMDYDSTLYTGSCSINNGTVGIGVPIPGDVDSDYTITMKDVGVLQRHLTGWSETVDETAADVWGDGKLSNKDLAMLQRHLAGWDVTLDASTAEVPAGRAITLPEIGSDIDVKKKKNRLLVQDTFILGNTIFMKVRNKTSNWITEEIDYIKYTCYDATGNAICTETLHIGVIDTKNHPQKIFVLTAPVGTAEIKITDSKITYWTEWS